MAGNQAGKSNPASKRMMNASKKAPYAYDFGKWMAKQQGTPGALEQERITGRTIHYINEHPRATEAQIKAAVIFGLARILDREAAEAL